MTFKDFSVILDAMTEKSPEDLMQIAFKAIAQMMTKFDRVGAAAKKTIFALRTKPKPKFVTLDARIK